MHILEALNPIDSWCWRETFYRFGHQWSFRFPRYHAETGKPVKK